MNIVNSYPHIETARRKLPKPVLAAMGSHPYRAVVAGGFLRAISCGNNPISDIDIFMMGKDKAEKVKHILDFLSIIHRERWVQKGVTWVLTKNAVTVRVEEQDVQMILGFDCEGPQGLLDLFDLTISKAAVWMQGAVSGAEQKMDGVCSTTFLRDVCQRRIVFDPMPSKAPAIPVTNSIPRICKFLRQGFTIDPASLMSFVALAANCLNSAESIGKAVDLIKTATREDADSRDTEAESKPAAASPNDDQPKVFRSLDELEKELWAYAARY